MKNRLIALLSALVVAMPAVVQADEAPAEPMAEEPAAEKSWEASVGVDWFSEYIFRGVDVLANEPFWNPTASVACHGFSIWYWGAFGDSTGTDDTYEENDYGVDYTFALLEEKLSITSGFQMFHYPDGNSGADTYEAYGVISYDVLLQPTASIWYDFDEIGGAYLTLGIGHSFDLSEAVELESPMAWTIDPSAALGLDLGYWSDPFLFGTGNDTDFNDLLLGVSTTLQVTEQIEVHAGIQVSVALDSLHDGGQGNELIGNVGASFSF